MRIAVFGASGRLGRRVLCRLRERGVEVLALVRRAASGKGLEAERIAVVADSEVLAEHLVGVSAVVHCASGPGEPVAAAALGAGVGYVDAIGDQGWIRRVYETLVSPAEAAGVVMAPAHGIDYALGDCLARLAIRELGSVEQLTLAYAPRGSGVAAGSARFAAETPGSEEVEFRNGRWVPAGWSGWRRFTFPPPLGRRLVTRYGSGEVITVPRHSRVGTVRSLILSSAMAPHPALELLLPLLRPLVARLRRSPLRSRLAGLARRATPAFQPEPEGGELTLVARARAPDGVTTTWVVEGSGFLRLSAELLARGAVRVAEDDAPGGGVYSAAQLFEPETLLGAIGVTWRRL